MFDYTQMLLNKVAQLEEAWTQKDKFIHSSRMIVKFREDHIYRLEKKLKAEPGLVSEKESQVVIDQLKDEIKILRDQVHHLNTALPTADVCMCMDVVQMYGTIYFLENPT